MTEYVCLPRVADWRMEDAGHRKNTYNRWGNRNTEGDIYEAMVAAAPPLPPDLLEAVELANEYKDENVSPSTMCIVLSHRARLARALLKATGLEGK